MLKKVNYEKYNQFLISAMKGITKDYESITKFCYSMKDHCKKNFTLHLTPYIQIPK